MEIERTYDQSYGDRNGGPTILIVDDEEASRTRMKVMCRRFDESSDFEIVLVDKIDTALEVLSRRPVYVCFLDKDLGETVNGIDYIPEMLQLQPHLQILMVTGSKDIQDAVQAMSYGACGFIPKDSPDDLFNAQIKRAIHVALLSIRNIRAQKAKDGDDIKLEGISAAIRKIKEAIPALAETAHPVLLLGESGTGKSTVARAIHEYRKQYLKQNDRPFFEVNLVAKPANLIDAELFGHEANAFTGAKGLKQGFFELGNQGTLFFDEIAEIPLETQAKLLTVLDSGNFYRVGGTRALHSSFKLICATNQNLEQMVREKRFRQDLYMRISTLEVRMPSLAERKEDIPVLMESLLSKCCKKDHIYVDFKDIPRDFIDHVVEHAPEGNIRGLEKMLSTLLIKSFKAKDGRRILTHWRKIPELMRPNPNGSGITFRELIETPFNVLGPDFPGLMKFTRMIQNKVLLEATQKFPNNRLVAKSVGMAESATLRRLRVMKTHHGRGKVLRFARKEDKRESPHSL